MNKWKQEMPYSPLKSHFQALNRYIVCKQSERTTKPCAQIFLTFSSFSIYPNKKYSVCVFTFPTFRLSSKRRVTNYLPNT